MFYVNFIFIVYMMLDDILLFFYCSMCVSNLYVKLSVLPFWPRLTGRRDLYLNGTIPGEIKENKK